MYIHQISVFIENKAGNLSKFTNFLADNQIDMRSFEIADAADFGIIRIIVDQPIETLTLLRENGWICNITEVIGVKIPDKPGSMAKCMSILAENKISVEYVHAFLARDTNDALMIFRVDDNEKVVSLLKKNGVTIISQEQLMAM